MITRAGVVGLGTGLAVSGVLWYPLYVVWPGLQGAGWVAGSQPLAAALLVAAALLMLLGGGLAAWWGAAAGQPARLGLGALAGGLAGAVVFGSLGAAAAGVAGLGAAARAGGLTVADLLRSTAWTSWMWWGLALGGSLLGLAGGLGSGRLAGPARWVNSPQMALNATLTALPAAAVAMMLAAGVQAYLPGLGGGPSLPEVLDWPLVTAGLLYLIAQLALMLVTPYEGRRSAHRCGLDEVKMAAYIGIGTPLALLASLLLINWRLAASPPALAAGLLSLGLVGGQVWVLYRIILPRRAQMPAPQDGVEALFFGTIAESRWQGLLVLCLGCGMMMLGPAYVAVAAPLINLASLPLLAGLPLAPTVSPAALTGRLYALQAAAGWGSSLAASLLLAGVYLAYLGLGRWFRRRRKK